MKYGDLDGLLTIYTESGEPLLKKNERVLVTTPEMKVTLSTGWYFYGGDLIFMPTMIGTLYLTNRRMIFLAPMEGSYRIPLRKKKEVGEEDEPKKREPKRLPITDKKRFGMEYCELGIRELIACEIRDEVDQPMSPVCCYLLADDQKFNMNLVLPEDAELLRRFELVRCKNTSELAQNLTAYKRRTTWIWGPEGPQRKSG